MNIKHFEIEIPSNHPFANCKLDREKYADVLTNIISSYPDGFVLALNNKWGTGKTTFVKMCKQSLKINEYQTLYFNAWENDFENDPLTALMGELKTLTTKNTEVTFKSVLKKASIFSKHLIPAITKAVVNKHIDTEIIQDAIVGISKSVTDIFENEVDQYEKRKESISEFKRSLGSFVANTSTDGKPLVFIIDELDRCRPDYAVSILEQIKHFFSIPNIVFVLSIDKEQLGNAVKGVYGSADIDADEYLRRFIDIEYSLPEPEIGKYYKYLFGYFKFDDFFSSQERLKYRGVRNDKSNFLSTCELLFTGSKVPLRQQEKIFSHARLALRIFKSNDYVLPDIFIFLVFIKICYNDFYEELKTKKLSFLEIQNKLKEIIKIEIDVNNEGTIIWLELRFLSIYNNYFQEGYSRKELIIQDTKTGKNISSVLSIFKDDSEGKCLRILEKIDSSDGSRNLDLSYFFKRIDLLEGLKT